MLKEKFNKLSGTEIRVKNQVNFYLMLCEWIQNQQNKKNEKEISKKEWDKKFKKWVKEEEIYTYNDKKIKNRFNFMINHLKKIGINYKNKFIIPKNINSEIIFNNLFKYSNKNSKNKVFPFKAMIDFTLKNPELNNAKKIINAFIVFDGEENFKDLYHKNVVDEIVKNLEIKIPKFKKPIKEQKFIDLILAKKEKKEIIEINDFFDYKDIDRKTYIWPIFSKKRERFQIEKLVKEINKISKKDFIIGIHKNRLNQIINNEYFDLFSRWLHYFGLIDVAGKKASIFYNKKITKIDNQYKIKKEEITKFPFSKEETSENIFSIADDNFEFKFKDKNLKSIGNSVIAEYFVNLYYAYRLKINPRNFSKFINTKVSNRLYPIFTAPGGFPDMSYYNDEILINVETTILNTKRKIENNEIFPCSAHFEESAKKHKKIDKKYLIFVSPIREEEIKEQFKRNALIKENKNSELIICTFDKLIVPQI